MRLGIGIGLDPSAGGTRGPPTGITLTAVASSKVFQRAIASTSGPVALAGTYSGGAPTGVQARVKLASDNSVVVDWTTLSAASIGGGAWSGTATVPQGGSYYAEVRCANATGVTATGGTNWYVGGVSVFYGQSNSLGLFTVNASAPAASSGTAYYDATTGWGAVPAANGVREYLNRMTSLTGVPWGAVNSGQSGVNIVDLLAGAGTGYYETLAARVTASGGGAEAFEFDHGEGDANTANPSAATYSGQMDTLHASVAALVGRTKAQIPMATGSLSKVTDVSFTQPDSSWWTIQNSKVTANSTYTNLSYSASNMDSPLNADGVHRTGAGHGNAGKRAAQHRGFLLALGGVSRPNWTVASITAVDATTTDVTLTHSMGTDFTPTSGITGFTVSNDNFGSSNVTPSAAVRSSATVIRLTHSDLGLFASRQLRYQYGKAPDVSAPVLDNGAITAPLNHTAAQTLTTPGLPSPTFKTVQTMTNTSGVNTKTGIDCGDGSADVLVVLAGVLQDGSNKSITSVTVTPSGGSTYTATVHVSNMDPAGSVTPSGWIASVTVPAGTNRNNCTVTATYSGDTFVNTRVSVWTVPLSDLSSTTPTGTDQARAAATLTQTAAPACSAGGFVVAAAADLQPTTNSCTWTGTASPTERSDVSGSGMQSTFADASNLSAGTAQCIATFVQSANTRILAVAWR